MAYVIPWTTSSHCHNDETAALILLFYTVVAIKCKMNAPIVSVVMRYAIATFILAGTFIVSFSHSLCCSLKGWHELMLYLFMLNSRFVFQSNRIPIWICWLKAVSSKDIDWVQYFNWKEFVGRLTGFWGIKSHFQLNVH